MIHSLIWFLKKCKHYLFHIRRFFRRLNNRIKQWQKVTFKPVIRSFRYILGKINHFSIVAFKIFFPWVVDRIRYMRLAGIINDAYGYDIRLKEQQRGDVPRVAVIARDARHYPKSSLFIRIISPLSFLARQGRLNFTLHTENTKKVPLGTDLIIVQRTAFDSKTRAERLIKYARSKDIPIVLDNDDDFRAIDDHHPEYLLQKKRLQGIEAISTAAHEVWVSTHSLAAAYKDLKGRVIVIGNNVDMQLWGKNKRTSDHPPSADKPLKIVYMGTATHGEDFKLIAGPLNKLHKKYPGQFSLTLIGISKNELTFPWLHRLFQPKGISLYPRFVKWFLEQEPYDIGLAPLCKSKFNDGKSDIKCLDYLTCGVYPIASKVTPYETSSLLPFMTLTANAESEWYSVLENAIVNRKKNRAIWAKELQRANTFIREHRTTRQSADIIYKRLGQLWSK